MRWQNAKDNSVHAKIAAMPNPHPGTRTTNAKKQEPPRPFLFL